MSSNLEAFQEPDPAADFLAREQNVLQALDDEYNYVNDNHFETLNGDVKDNDTEDLNDLNGVGDEEISEQSINKIKSSGFEVKEPKEEPETIRKWREEHQRLLEEKDKDEAKRKEELRESAKKELEEWYLRYSEQLEKSKHSNREACKLAEKEWIAERDAESPGLEWEKIARMCDFNPKSSRNQRDTSRMRSILLQLKQSPPSTGSSKDSSTS